MDLILKEGKTNKLRLEKIMASGCRNSSDWNPNYQQFLKVLISKAYC